MTGISMRNYKIVVSGDEPMTADQARKVIETIDRGLWGTNHGVLRDNVTSVRHELSLQARGGGDVHPRVIECIDAFNQLDSSSLNTRLLDDASLPRSPHASTRTSSNDEVRALQEEIERIKSRVDGHDRRHEEAEENLAALNGAVGIVKNPEGAWVPVPDGQFDRNSRVQKYLGYNRDGNGDVTFARTDGRPRWALGFAIGTVIGVVFYVITGVTWGWSAMIIPAIALLFAIATAVAFLAPNKSVNNAPATDTQPRG